MNRDPDNEFGWRLLGFFFLACLGLALLFFSKPILRGQPFLIGDMDTLFYPQAQFFNQSIRQGHFPLWNPLVFCGVPFAAEPRSFAFYPPYWLLVLIPSAWTIYPLLAFHLAVAGCGTAFLARNAFRSSPWAAFAAGTIYAFSGFFCFKMEHLDQVMTCAWFPWLFWAVLRFLKGPTGKRLAVLSLFYAIPFLTGALESLAYATMSLAAVATACCFQLYSGNWKMFCRVLVLTAAALVLGAGLGGIQLLPTLEMYRFAARWAGFERGHAGWESMPPWRFLTEIFLPNFWPPSQTIAGVTVQRVPTGFAGYIGLAAYLCSAHTVWSKWKLPAVRGLSALGAFAVIISFGRFTPVYGWLYDLGLSPFRHPTHFKIIFILCAAVLAAPAIEALVRQRQESPRRFHFVFLSLAAILFAAGILFLNRRLFVLAENSPSTLLLGDLLFGFLAGTCVYAAWVCRNRVWKPWLVLAALFLPLMAFARYSPLWNPEPLNREQAARLESLTSLVRHELGPYRTFTDHCIDLRVHRAMPYALPDVYGYESGLMPLRRYWELKQSMTEGSHLAETPGRRLLDLLGARFLFRDSSIPDEKLKLWRHADRYFVYENPYARARVNFVTQSSILEDSQALEKIARGNWDPGTEVILDTEPAVPLMAESSVAFSRPSIVSERSNSVAVKVSASQPGFLVLGDTFYPGWEVRVDGERRPLLRANYLFRAVALEPGQHQVLFQFKPASLTAGSGLSIICALVLLCAATRKRKDENETVRA